MSYKILVVGKNSTIANIHYKALAKAAGIAYDVTSHIKTALELLEKNKYDMLITGINVDGSEGFELIESVRSREIDIPIVVVSARNAENDILYALDLGADDFCSYPINPVIFIAKIKSWIRRYRHSTHNVSNETVAIGPFSYNKVSMKLYKNGIEIPMSSKENAMMKLFIDNVDKTFSREKIHNLIWGESPVDNNKVMVYINRIRSKIEDDSSHPKHLITIRNIGYKFTVNKRH